MSLQQNFIRRIEDSFLHLNKLVELRLDKNKLVKVENLTMCISLRKVNFSYNSIESLEGLNGLQNLQELKISNNLIKSLIPLKALPSIRELDVSHNQLKTLDGIKQLPTLELLRADHNQIVHLKIIAVPSSFESNTADMIVASSSSVTSTGKSRTNAAAALANASKAHSVGHAGKPAKNSGPASAPAAHSN